MKDIDIYGIATDGKQICAQVTYAKFDDVAWKKERLQPYREPDRSHLILFCRADAQRTVDGVFVVPIDLVASDFLATPEGQDWFAQAIYAPPT